MVALATVSRGLASHPICMLTVALATVLCHCKSGSAFLEAGKTGPDQKRAQGQNRYTHYPQAMSVTLFHRPLVLTKQPKSFGQSLLSFFREIVAGSLSGRVYAITASPSFDPSPW